MEFPGLRGMELLVIPLAVDGLMLSSIGAALHPWRVSRRISDSPSAFQGPVDKTGR